MVPLADLKEIIILNNFSDEMLLKFQPLLKSETFNENDLVFQEQMPAESFYMIKNGKVLLEKRISENITISMGAIKTGYSFGWSSMLGKIPFSMAARCAEKSTILSLKASDATELFARENAMGYIFIRHLSSVMKNRLDRMEERLIRSLREHPDFKSVL